MKPMFNRAPLTQNNLAPLPLGSIRPEGWLGDQLRVQADDLSGPLHEAMARRGRRLRMAGRNGDGWERAPYYLDGLVALAWTLEDEKLRALALHYIEWILAASARTAGSARRRTRTTGR